MSREADVIVDLQSHGRLTEVRFEFPATPGVKPVEGVVSTTRLTDLRRRTGSELERAADLLGGLRPSSLVQAEETFAALQVLGEQVGQALVGDESWKLRPLQKAFRAVRLKAAGASHQVQLMEVRGDHQFLPLQIVPFFGFAKIPPIKNDYDVTKLASRFLGFSMALHYELPHSEVMTTRSASDWLLQLFHYGTLVRIRKWFRSELVPELPATKQERDFLSSRSGQVLVEGPWPSDGEATVDARERLLDLLFDPRLELATGTPRSDGKLTGIQHFSCHCIATADDSDSDFELVLATPSGQEVRINLEHLRSGFARREQPDEDEDEDEDLWEEDRPLVVLNACASAQVSYRSTSSFPTWFIANRHRGVVSTEAAVHDDIAGQFCQFFYDAILSGSPLAEALVLARRKLLDAHANPVGLVYSYFGSPLLKVSA